MWTALLLILFPAWLPVSGLFQATDVPTIQYPQAGQALQGVVTVSGSTELPGFQSAEVSFAYLDDPTATWFPIETSQAAVKSGDLAVWDTTVIADGIYRLRVRVVLVGGRAVETVLEGLRVRNYTPVETSTPEPVPTVVQLETETPAIPTPTKIVMVGSPTQLPPNPVLVTQGDIQASAVRGAAITLGLFSVFGIYLALKKMIQRS